MNKRLQGFVAGILCYVLFAGINVFAKNTSETIQAIYRDIKIYVDGIKTDPKDANGDTVEPFIYNGTTYLPVRAVGEAIGKQVIWDGETSSVYLGGKPGEVSYLMDVCPPYDVFTDDYGKCNFYTTSNGNSFLMGGKKYTNGFTLGNANWDKTEIYFNLEAKYKAITLYLGTVDGTEFSITHTRSSNDDTVVGFYIDDKLVKDYTLKNGDLPQKVTIPVNYGMKLKITHDVRDGSVGFGNITIE